LKLSEGQPRRGEIELHLLRQQENGRKKILEELSNRMREKAHPEFLKRHDLLYRKLIIRNAQSKESMLDRRGQEHLGRAIKRVGGIGFVG